MRRIIIIIRGRLQIPPLNVIIGSRLINPRIMNSDEYSKKKTGKTDLSIAK